MHFLQAINSDISVLIVCNKTGGTIKGDIKKRLELLVLTKQKFKKNHCLDLHDWLIKLFTDTHKTMTKSYKSSNSPYKFRKS